MNHDFDRRWKIAARAAQRSEGGESSLETPPGFSTRILACWRPRPSPPTLALLWQTLALRTLGIMAAVLFVLTGFALWTEPAQPALTPPIAEIVGEQLFSFE